MDNDFLSTLAQILFFIANGAWSVYLAWQKLRTDPRNTGRLQDVELSHGDGSVCLTLRPAKGRAVSCELEGAHALSVSSALAETAILSAPRARGAASAPVDRETLPDTGDL